MDAGRGLRAAEPESVEPGGGAIPDDAFYAELARSFLRNNNIPLHRENLFKADVLLQIAGRETGQIRISAVKVLLEWAGQLKRKSRDDEDAGEELSGEEALKLICSNLKEMGITREQLGKWMS